MIKGKRSRSRKGNIWERHFKPLIPGVTSSIIATVFVAGGLAVTSWIVVASQALDGLAAWEKLVVFILVFVLFGPVLRIIARLCKTTKGKTAVAISYVLALVLIGWWLLSPPSVDSLFAEAYKQHIDELGKAKSRKGTSKIIYQAFHDRAMLIYFQDLKGWYVLFNQTGKWEYKRDDAMAKDTEWEDQWGNKNWLNNNNWMGDNSRPPERRKCPDGGVAKLWCDSPGFWRQIGWKRWDCAYAVDATYYQKFQRGLILGPLRSAEDKEIPQLLILSENHEYFFDPSQSINTSLRCDQSATTLIDKPSNVAPCLLWN